MTCHGQHMPTYANILPTRPRFASVFWDPKLSALANTLCLPKALHPAARVSTHHNEKTLRRDIQWYSSWNICVESAKPFLRGMTIVCHFNVVPISWSLFSPKWGKPEAAKCLVQAECIWSLCSCLHGVSTSLCWSSVQNMNRLNRLCLFSPFSSATGCRFQAEANCGNGASHVLICLIDMCWTQLVPFLFSSLVTIASKNCTANGSEDGPGHRLCVSLCQTESQTGP